MAAEKYDFKKIEKEINQFWRKINLLELLEEQNKKGESYFLLDGPPYANNVPHVGHVRNTIYKDLYIRINFMRGRNVYFQPGFDTHGLPVENMIEKKLELKSKQDIEKFGIAEFMKTCKEHAAMYKDLWIKAYDTLGSWYSWREPYMTFHNSYLEGAWWAFKKMWDKDWVYEGQKPVTWCPHCQTALAGYEVTDSYKNLSDPSVIVKFKLKSTEDDHLLIFTTTPWTLPSNTVICVHPDKDYVKVSTKDKGNLILAKQRIELLEEIGIKDYSVLEEFKGKKLDGQYYEPLFDIPQQKELKKNPKCLRVYMSIALLKERVTSKVATKKVGVKARDVFEEFVSVEEGTGLVHCVPGAGKTDNDVGKHYGLPNLSPLDDECKFTEDVGKYAGKYVKDADHEIADDLHKNGTLLHYERKEHAYPVCWRCKAPLIFKMSNQWFLKIEPIKDIMLTDNEKVNWQPEFARGRFREWVTNAEDWNFSRQRYWGIPIPVWKCECGEKKAIGNLKELKEKALEDIPDDFDLHTVNLIHMRCEKCSGTMNRINDIFDVWFDSGVSPWASMGYPNDNKELFKEHFPVSRVNESQDQIRGWFYSLMFCSVATFGKAPYKAVSMPGWVVDNNGEKFSKSLGNGVEVEVAVDKIGADSLRFYYCWDIAPYALQKFSMETAGKEVHKMLNILWNLHSYLLAEAEDKKIEKFNEDELKAEDRWIISRFNNSIQALYDSYDSFEIHEGGRKIYEFIVNDLSRTYVKMVRDRVEDEKIPLQVLNHCLVNTVIALAPITPFISDKIYRDLAAINTGFKESVHLVLLPKVGKGDKRLEEEFIVVQDLIASILGARDKAQLGVRWPISEVIIEAHDESIKAAIDNQIEIVQRLTNVRKIGFGIVPVKIKAKIDFKSLGKEFGQETGDAAEAMQKDMAAIEKHLEAGKTEFKIGKFNIKKDFFTLTTIPPEEYASSDFRGKSIYLFKEITSELFNEG
ncbi:MAG: isoleucine--tRNA ligase, partial [Nanoarchaeota archaeon]|nr:isoleucine--tRNA ligase [Nanoarchaeota archaeon]